MNSSPAPRLSASRERRLRTLDRPRTEPRMPVYTPASRYLRDVPSSVLFHDRQPDYASRFRSYFTDRGLVVPHIADVASERLHRQQKHGSKVAAVALARTYPEPLPMLSNVPSEMTARRLRAERKEAA